MLLRSDNLQSLTERDIAVLTELGLGLVVDLRTEVEVRQEGPGPLIGRVEHRHRSLYVEADPRPELIIAASPEDPDEPPAVRWYLGYLRNRPDSIVGALSDIATSDGAVLVHCAAGKDRTGVVVALALEVAGVPREAILSDFLLTGDRIAAIMTRLRATPTYAADLAPYTDESRRPRREVLERVLEVLDERFGGPVGWLHAQGFDPAPLRARLTNP